MNRLSIYFVVLLVFVVAIASAQTSLSPLPKSSDSKTSGFFSPKLAKTVKHRKPKVKHTAQYEFYKRVEQAAKDKQRILKKLSRPQFSNPAYFGHKRKPKKRPPHRMRYCSECHIRH
jgi:hypothetical protein